LDAQALIVGTEWAIRLVVHEPLLPLVFPQKLFEFRSECRRLALLWRAPLQTSSSHARLWRDWHTHVQRRGSPRRRHGLLRHGWPVHSVPDRGAGQESSSRLHRKGATL